MVAFVILINIDPAGAPYLRPAKLHLWLHTGLLAVAYMLADANTVFLQKNLKNSIFAICLEK